MLTELVPTRAEAAGSSSSRKGGCAEVSLMQVLLMVAGLGQYRAFAARREALFAAEAAGMAKEHDHYNFKI